MIGKQEVENQLESLKSIIFFQVSNGVINYDDISKEGIKTLIEEVHTALEKNELTNAMKKLDEAHIRLYDLLNRQGLVKRLLHLYGLPVMLFLTLFLLFLIMEVTVGYPCDLSRTSIATYVVNRANGEVTRIEVTGDVIWWGGLGAAAYSLYYLRKNIFQYQLSKYYQVYYTAYSLAGLAFGTGAAVILAGGLATVSANPNEAVFFSIAFLAGLLQHWALSLLYSIAESIHKPKS